MQHSETTHHQTAPKINASHGGGPPYPQWFRVSKLGVGSSYTATPMPYLFETCRYRVEGARYEENGAAQEYRIPCTHGEVYQVGEKTWGWCGSSPIVSQKLVRLLGNDAGGPFGGPPIVSRSSVVCEEQVIWFPEGRVEEVLAVAKAKRRGRPGLADNLRQGGR